MDTSNLKKWIFILFLVGGVGWSCQKTDAEDQQWQQVIERNKLLASTYDNFYRIIAETTTAAEGTMAQARTLHDREARKSKMREAIQQADPVFLQQLATFQPRMDSIEIQRNRLVSQANVNALREAQQNSELARRLASESHMNLINPLGTVKQAADLCERIDQLLADAEYTLEEAKKRLDETNDQEQ